MQQFHWEVKKKGDAVTFSQEEVWDNIVQLYGDLLHKSVLSRPIGGLLLPSLEATGAALLE